MPDDSDCDLGHTRPDQGRPIFQARLHDRGGRGGGGIYAGGRPGPRRRHHRPTRRAFPRATPRSRSTAARCLPISRVPKAPPIRPSSWSRWRCSACTNTSRTWRAGSPSSARSRSRRTIISARASISPRSTDVKELLPIVNAKPDAELVADLDADGGLGEIARRRRFPARHRRLLPGRARGVDLCRAQRCAEGGRRVLRLARRSAESGLAEKPD